MDEALHPILILIAGVSDSLHSPKYTDVGYEKLIDWTIKLLLIRVGDCWLTVIRLSFLGMSTIVKSPQNL